MVQGGLRSLGGSGRGGRALRRPAHQRQAVTRRELPQKRACQRGSSPILPHRSGGRLFSSRGGPRGRAAGLLGGARHRSACSAVLTRVYRTTRSGAPWGRVGRFEALGIREFTVADSHSDNRRGSQSLCSGSTQSRTSHYANRTATCDETTRQRSRVGATHPFRPTVRAALPKIRVPTSCAAPISR